MSKALVIGGSGFIGMHCLRLLTGRGTYERIISVDLIEPHERLAGVEYKVHDARNPLPEEWSDKDTVIYNLAALRTYPGHADAEYLATNVGTTERVIELARKTGVQTILFTSTMSVYPTGNSRHAEDSRIAPDNIYGASKLVAEEHHQTWLAEDPSRRLVVCRPAVIFGFRDNGNFTRLSNALKRRYFVFAGGQTVIKSAGYVGDLAESFEFALGHRQLSETGCIVYNFAYPERLTIGEIVAAFCKVCGYPKPLLTLPRPLLEVLALPFEGLNAIGVKNPIHRKRIGKLCEATDILPQWLQDEGFEFSTNLETALAQWQAECSPLQLY